MHDIPRQLLYRDKKGYGDISPDQKGLYDAMFRICERLISRCDLNDSRVDVNKIINESLYLSIKLNQLSGEYSELNDAINSELSSTGSSKGKTLMTKIIIYILLSLSSDGSSESNAMLEQLQQSLLQEVPNHTDFSEYGFMQWLNREKGNVGLSIDLKPRPCKIDALSDREIYEATDHFSEEGIRNIIALYQSEAEKKEAIQGIKSSFERHCKKYQIPQNVCESVTSILSAISGEPVAVDYQEPIVQTEEQKQIEEQKKVIEKLQSILRDKDSVISEQQKSIDELQSQLDSANADIQVYNDSLQEADNTYRKLSDTIARQNEMIRQCEQYIEELTSKEHAQQILQDSDNTLTNNIASRMIPLEALVNVAKNWGDRELARKFDLFIRKALDTNITGADITLLNSIDDYYAQLEEKRSKSLNINQLNMGNGEQTLALPQTEK